MEMKRFWDKVDKSGECWIWTAAKDSGGYGQFFFEGKNIKAHRVSFYLTNGYWPNHTRHTCDNPPCVNPNHLLSRTRKENNDDIYKRERNSGIKAAEVKAIRNLPMTRTIIADVSKAYNISEPAARNIIDGTVWSRLPGARKIIRQKPRSKLSIQDIQEIKKELDTDSYWGQINELAHRYGVSASSISLIKRGKSHQDISI